MAVTRNAVVLLLMVSALVTVQVRAAENARCPSNLPTTSLMVDYNERCYQFVGDERYWNGARDYCIQHGGRLVKIGDADTNAFIVSTLNSLWWRNNGVWIGLHDRNVEMSWQWVGFQPYTSEPVQWTNWGSGHPRGFLHTMRDCVRMVRGSGNWLWHETPCQTLNWKYRFICEYEMTATSPPVIPTTTTVLTRNSHGAAVARRPDSSERRVHSSTLLSTIVDTGHQDMATGEFEDLYEDRNTHSRPVHQAIVDNEEEIKPADSNKLWIVAVICAAGATVLLVVGLLLWRRKRYQNSKMDASGSDVKSTDDAKSAKPSDCKPDSLHHVEDNIYISAGTTPQTGYNIYEDIETRADRATSSEVTSSLSANQAEGHDYFPMSGSRKSCGKYVAAGKPKCSEVPASYIASNQSLPEYKNYPVEVEEEDNGDGDCGMMGYDMPRPANIYSEIPEVDCDIYESLDQYDAKV